MDKGLAKYFVLFVNILCYLLIYCVILNDLPKKCLDWRKKGSDWKIIWIDWKIMDKNTHFYP